VICVETNPESVQYGRENLLLFSPNVTDEKYKFVNRVIMNNIINFTRMFTDREKPLMLIVNPPRAGMHKKITMAICKNENIKYIAYITCDLKRSFHVLSLLLKQGNFKIRATQVIDMFPRTDKWETIIFLEKIIVP
jgi:tRNA/tmRNA/rRNA uracil-C5-methylase (TrmA/RlmC/RlmD family)